jgi:hypothetical protein
MQPEARCVVVVEGIVAHNTFARKKIGVAYQDKRRRPETDYWEARMAAACAWAFWLCAASACRCGGLCCKHSAQNGASSTSVRSDATVLDE